MDNEATIFALNGGRRLLEQASKVFIHERPTFLLIKGPSGSGKSRLAEVIAKQFENASAGDRALVLSGDSGREEEDYYTLESLKKTSRFRETIAKASAGVVSDVLGGSAELALRQLFHFSQKVDSDGVDRSTAGLIDLISTLSANNRILLVLDDFQFFDRASLQMIQRLAREAASPEWSGYKLRVLATINTSIKPAHKSAMAGALNYFATLGELEYCSRPDLPILMKALGLKSSPTDDELDRLHVCTSGHLEVLRTFVSEDNLSALLEEHRTPNSPLEFFRDMMASLLADHLGDSVGSVRTVLAAASVIGEQSAAREVSCVTSLSVEEVETAAALARQMKVLTDEEASIRFRHQIIWQYFSEGASRSRLVFHSKYAWCLRSIKPSHYMSRAKHHVAAKQYELAAIAAIHHTIQQQESRQQHDTSTVDWRTPPWSGLRHLATYERTILAAYRACHEGNYALAIETAESIDDGYPESLRAERDLLIAKFALHHLDLRHRQRSVDVLLPWVDVLGDDRDVWARLMAVAVFAHVQLGRFEEAERLERKMFLILAPNINHDKAIHGILNRVKSYSNMHRNPEGAKRRIEAVVDYYRESGLDKRLEFANDFMISLTNLSAVELELGNYGSCAHNAKEALGLIQSVKVGHLQSPRPAANNLLIAEFLSGDAQPLRLATKLEEVMWWRSGSDDLLMRNNIASALMYAGALDDAERALEHLIDDIRRIDGCDDYYAFFPTSNLAVMKIIRGDWQGGRDLLDSAAQMMATMPPGCTPQLAKQQQALRAIALEQVPLASALELDSKIRAKDGIGAGADGWRFWGRGPLFSSLEIWLRV